MLVYESAYYYNYNVLGIASLATDRSIVLLIINDSNHDMVTSVGEGGEGSPMHAMFVISYNNIDLISFHQF